MASRDGPVRNTDSGIHWKMYDRSRAGDKAPGVVATRAHIIIGEMKSHKYLHIFHTREEKSRLFPRELCRNLHFEHTNNRLCGTKRRSLVLWVNVLLRMTTEWSVLMRTF